LTRLQSKGSFTRQMKPIRAVLPALLLIAACSSPPEYHLRDPATGEQFEQVTYFTPRRDENGAIIGYEEPLPPGYVLRDLQGRRVGVRYTDLRSRGTNLGSGGVTVIVNPPERQ